MTTARPEPAQRPDPRPADAPELRLSVWPTAQRDARAQRRGRYLPESTAHPAKMLPAIAATAIRRYTKLGDLVADPMCGIGTTLVEAVHLGRDGLGIEYEDRWASLAAANVAHARRQGAAGSAEVIRGDAPELRLSVWPTAQRDARTQRRGRYLPESTAHPAKMLPAIAATAIARYTEPGDLVADPMCGIGTTVV